MAGRLKIYNANTSQWEYTSADFSSNVTQILNEVPSGLVNGSNTAYTTASTYVSGSLKVFKNGIRLKGAGNDYTESAGGFTMVVAPATGTTLLVDYNVSTGIYSTGVNTFEPLQIPAGTVNGTNAVFTCAKSYIGSTLQVYINGVLQAPTTHYVETTPSTGVFTMGDAPLTGDNVLVTYQHEFAASGDADTVDGIHASATPTANAILPLDGNSKFPISVMPTQEAWIEVGSGGSAPAFTNSWVNFNAAYSSCAYMKDSMGFVHLKGFVKSGTVNSSIFTLPVGYRPSLIEYFAVVSNDAFAEMEIHTSGTVRIPAGGSNVYATLNGITFRAGN